MKNNLYNFNENRNISAVIFILATTLKKFKTKTTASNFFQGVASQQEICSAIKWFNSKTLDGNVVLYGCHEAPLWDSVITVIKRVFIM
jgi:hypothetical protein